MGLLLREVDIYIRVVNLLFAIFFNLELFLGDKIEDSLEGD